MGRLARREQRSACAKSRVTREIKCHEVQKNDATNTAVTREIEKVIAFDVSLDG